MFEKEKSNRLNDNEGGFSKDYLNDFCFKGNDQTPFAATPFRGVFLNYFASHPYLQAGFFLCDSFPVPFTNYTDRSASIYRGRSLSQVGRTYQCIGESYEAANGLVYHSVRGHIDAIWKYIPDDRYWLIAGNKTNP